MIRNLVPPISLAAADYRDLAALAHVALDDRHPVADFLMSELRRARIQQSVRPDVVSLGRPVTFRVDTEPPETRTLVHPDGYQRAERHVSVLSPVGAALLGLCADDRMPFVGVEGFLHFVTVLAVGTSAKVVDFSLARRRRRLIEGEDDGRDPDPSAA